MNWESLPERYALIITSQQLVNLVNSEPIPRINRIEIYAAACAHFGWRMQSSELYSIKEFNADSPPPTELETPPTQ